MTIQRTDQVGDQYSKIVVSGGVVYLAGLIAEDSDSDIQGQSKQIFDQIDMLLARAGTSKSRLLSLTVYIASFDDYRAFKEAYGSWMDHTNLPARATVGAQLLDPKLKIEIQAIAAI